LASPEGLGLREEARAAYFKAIHMAPSQALPLFFYAGLQAEEGDLSGAVTTLTAARRIAPEDARLATAQGQHLAKLGRVAEARVAYHAALTINPADTAARRGLATISSVPSSNNGAKD